MKLNNNIIMTDRISVIYDLPRNEPFCETRQMNKPKSQKQNNGLPSTEKTDRLAKALRENLLKRKSQKRGRTDSGTQPAIEKGKPDHG